MHGRTPDTIKQRCQRGVFHTARKIGRNWVIDSEEKLIDNRRKNAMKKLLRDYEPNKSELEGAGICAIYYNAKGEWIAEHDGAGYSTIYDDDMPDELKENITARVARGDGEEMGADDFKSLQNNIDFEFDF